jgi:hypothetical protein
MIVRIWRTRIDERRAADYDAFVSSKSMPMFRCQPGFLGALFASDGSKRLVISLWRDRSSAGVLNESSTYVSTVRELETTGILIGTSPVEVLQLDRLLILDRGALAEVDG